MATNSSPFQTKICGVISCEDAAVVVDAGADAVGLNFFASSPRYVEVELAKEIAESVRGQIKLVGLFVNHSLDEISRIDERVGLDFFQLHGDESPELIQQLPHRKVIKAFRCKESNWDQINRYLGECLRLESGPRAVLLDAFSETEFGGTGRKVDWELVGRREGNLNNFPVILAGGLNPANLEAAIAQANPDGVDTASGVEISPGKKSPQLSADFVRAAKRCLGSA